MSSGVVVLGLAEAFRSGGPWTYLIFLISLLMVPALVVLTVLRARGRRLPGILWWVGPIVLLVLGGLAAVFQQAESLQALEMVSPERRPEMMGRGLAFSLAPLAFAAFVTTIYTSVMAIACGVSAAGATEDQGPRRLSFALVLFVTVLIGAGAAGVLPIAAPELNWYGFFAPGALLLAGIGATYMAATLRGDDEHSIDLAADGYIVAGAVVIATAAATLYAVISALQDTFYALETTTPEARIMTYEVGMEMVSQMGFVGLVSGGFALATAVILVTGARKYALHKKVIGDVAVWALAFVPALAVLGWAGQTTVTHFPPAEVIVVTAEADVDEP